MGIIIFWESLILSGIINQFKYGFYNNLSNVKIDNIFY